MRRAAGGGVGGGGSRRRDAAGEEEAGVRCACGVEEADQRPTLYGYSKPV